MSLLAVASSASSSSSPLHLHPHHQDAFWQMNMRSREQMELGSYPVREGEPDCSYYVRTGLCRFGATCRFNHPPNRAWAIAAATRKGEFPERIGQPECQYYLKTGACKFGPTCKFHHPKDKAGIAGSATLNVLGYPLRPDEVECAYYMRNGQCKFGITCKFHHPQPSNQMVSSAVYPPTSGQLSFPRASFIPSPRWESPSNYAPLFMSVPGWNAYSGQVGSVSPSENRTVGNSQNYGTLQDGEGINAGSDSVPVGYYAFQRDNVFPERPGQPECQFYMKTGDCKFGAVCKFHHPRERHIPAPDCVLSPIGLPLRPGEPLCVFYSRYGICKFGPSCKFDHPMRGFAYNGNADRTSVLRLMASSSSSSPGTVALSFSPDRLLEAASAHNRRPSLSEPRQKPSAADNNIETE